MGVVGAARNGWRTDSTRFESAGKRGRGGVAFSEARRGRKFRVLGFEFWVAFAFDSNPELRTQNPKLRVGAAFP